MASARLTSVVIADDRLYVPGGMAWRWVRKVTLRFSREAKRAAPRRSGELRAGIRSTTPRSYYKTIRGTIRSDAPHSLFVIHGTTGPIYTNAGWAMRVMPIPSTMRPAVPIGKNRMIGKGFTPIMYAPSVSGQRPNNFFLIAWARTGRAHPAIRGVGLPAGLR